MRLCYGSGFDNNFEIPFQYSKCLIAKTPNILKLCYWWIPHFQLTSKHRYPKIGWNWITFKTPLSNFKQPLSSNFHNPIIGPSFKLHIALVGETLYCITSHLEKSTKNKNRCVFICLTNTIRPSFKS